LELLHVLQTKTNDMAVFEDPCAKAMLTEVVLPHLASDMRTHSPKPCRSRRQAKVLGRRASQTRRRSSRNWRLGADRGLAANFLRPRPDWSRDRWTRSPEC